jgi:polyhydroxyalkanoate synthesis repressor PhaR
MPPGRCLPRLAALLARLDVSHKTVARPPESAYFMNTARHQPHVRTHDRNMTATMTAATTTKTVEPITIKKYANRRLYNTGTSAYVTLEDLAGMVKTGEDFVVYDAKSGEEITRSVLTQIIFEQENKEGQNLLPIAFLRQLIRFYGDSMQMLVPRYLEVSIESLTREQEKFRHQMAQAFGVGGFPSLEDQVRRNMEMFERAFTMFAPFARRESQAAEAAAEAGNAPPKTGEIDDLKRQLDEMQRKVDRLSDKGPTGGEPSQ